MNDLPLEILWILDQINVNERALTEEFTTPIEKLYELDLKIENGKLKRELTQKGYKLVEIPEDDERRADDVYDVVEI